MLASISGSRAVLVLAALSLAASAALAQHSQTRDLAGFDSITVGGNVDLVIRQGGDFSVEVITEDAEDLARVITEVNDGTLEIHQREPGGWFNFDFIHSSVEVAVTMPELRALRTSGASDTRTDGDLSGERLEIRASGGSDLRLALDVDELIVRTSGGSDAIFSGRTGLLEARSSGGSDLQAAELTARVAELRGSGGSDMMVAVTDRLEARASGGSDIIYSGNPSETDIDSSGGADVVKR
jgi:hypothetical protein